MALAALHVEHWRLVFRQMGIRARLLVAFFGISFFAALAGAVALFSFLVVGKALDQIARYETPEAIESLEISREAELMVSAAPAMLTATSVAQLDQIRTSIEAHSKRIDKKLSRLKANNGENRALETVEWAVQQLHTNTQKLHDLIVDRFKVSDTRKRLLGDFREGYSKLLRLQSSSTTEWIRR